MKPNINTLLRQLENYIECRDIAAKKTVKSDETQFYIIGTTCVTASFFVIVITFTQNEVIGAISTTFGVEGLLQLMADEDGFDFNYKYIYPICSETTMWTDIEYPLVHLMNKGEELYGKDGFCE